MKNLTFTFEIESVIGVAIGLDNYNPRKDYDEAHWELDILILCFHFNWTLTYPYDNN